MMYKLSIKRDGKWMTVGNIKTNQFGNLQLGIRMTDEVEKILAEAKQKGWLNLAVFEDNGEKPQAKPIETQETTHIDTDIPF